MKMKLICTFILSLRTIVLFSADGSPEFFTAGNFPETDRWSLGIRAGYQNLVATAEAPFRGLSLIPGVTFPVQSDFSFSTSKTFVDFLDTVGFSVRTLPAYDAFTPVSASFSFVSKPLSPLRLRFSVEPVFISGVDMNIWSVKIKAGGNLGPVFAVAGCQAGLMLSIPSPVYFATAFSGLGTGFSLGEFSFRMSVEACTDFLSRHQVLGGLGVRFFIFDLSGGFRFGSVDGTQFSGPFAGLELSFCPPVKE